MTDTIPTKVCTGVCKKEKPLIDFYRNSRKPDGHDNVCKECERNRRASLEAVHSAAWKPRMQKRRDTLDRSKRENFILYMTEYPQYFRDNFGKEPTIENINCVFDSVGI